jgi:ribonuclease P protein component
MNALSGSPKPFNSLSLEPAVQPGRPFLKSSRILKSSGFRRVYDQGTRYSSRLFTAFCLDIADPARPPGARIGFTVPRAIGKAVTRNRIKRRMREAFRLDLPMMGPQWDVVVNPRRTVLDAPFDELRDEVRKLISRCKP